MIKTLTISVAADNKRRTSEGHTGLYVKVCSSCHTTRSFNDIIHGEKCRVCQCADLIKQIGLTR